MDDTINADPRAEHQTTTSDDDMSSAGFEIDDLPVSARLQTRLKRAVKTNSNVLWDRYIRPSLIIDDLRVFTHLSSEKKWPFCHRGAVGVDRPTEVNESMKQTDFALFTAPHRIPKYGPIRDEWTRTSATNWEPPSERTALGDYWVFTLEHDPSDLEGFERQFDWLAVGKSLEGTAVGGIHSELLNLKDYRGFNVTWSGNKSIHIHFVFDTTHLSKAVLTSWCERTGKRPEAKLRDHYQGTDLAPDALKGYYRDRWFALVEIAKRHIPEDITFDPALAQLHQKRRLPWGRRQAETENLLRIPAGAYVPQIVVAEKIIMTAPRGANGYFLDAKGGNIFIQQSSRPVSHNRQPRTEFDHATLLQALTTYLRDQWGTDYPKPAGLEEAEGRWTATFFNHEHDRHPSTICQSGYAQLMPSGLGALEKGADGLKLPDGQTLDDILVALQDQLAGPPGTKFTKVAGGVLRQKGTMSQRLIAANSSNKQGIRKGVGQALDIIDGRSDFNVVVSAEGVGKSYDLMTHAVRRRIDAGLDHGSGQPDRATCERRSNTRPR